MSFSAVRPERDPEEPEVEVKARPVSVRGWTGFQVFLFVVAAIVVTASVMGGVYVKTRPKPTPIPSPTQFPMQDVVLPLPAEAMTYTKELITKDGVPLHIDAIIPQQPTPPPPAPTSIPTDMVVTTATMEFDLALGNGVLSVPAGTVLQAVSKRANWVVLQPVDAVSQGWISMSTYKDLHGNMDFVKTLPVAGDFNPDEKAELAKAAHVITSTLSSTVTKTSLITTTKAIAQVTKTSAVTSTAPLSVTMMVTDSRIVRLGPGKNYAQTAKLAPKTEVVVHAKSPDGKWLRVAVFPKGKSEYIGWMDQKDLIFSAGVTVNNFRVSTELGYGEGPQEVDDF